MKSIINFKLLMILMLLIPAAVLAESEQNVYVTVRSSKLRTQPKHYASAVVAVKYGDALQKINAAEGWLKVKSASGQQGYIHESSVSVRKVVLKAGAGFNQTNDGSDVVLAGKGFSPEVERNYKAQNADVDYKSVDEMERYRVSDQEIAAFISNGKLG